MVKARDVAAAKARALAARVSSRGRGKPPSAPGFVLAGEGSAAAGVRNKTKRLEIYAAEKAAKKAAKRERQAERRREAEALGDAAPAKAVPKTIESTREADEAVCQPGDEELAADEATDEFASHFGADRPPNVLLTTSRKPSAKMIAVMRDLLTVFPMATFYERRAYELKEIVRFATKRGFTDVVVLHEDAKVLNSVLVTHLPEGPTARFKLTSWTPIKAIKGHGRATKHKPELVLNNFTTRLGHRVGRMFASLFCQDPNFRGRRVITFHNQRDFVFFRHHRYVFEGRPEKEKAKDKARGRDRSAEDGAAGLAIKREMRARLQECGPRFTLKLQSMQKGTFDSKHGEYEFKHAWDMDTSRRRFYL